MEEKAGTVRIAPNVLATTARLTALSVSGVVRMAEAPHLVRMRRYNEGVRISVTDDAVTVDLYLIVQEGGNMLEISREVQRQVTRAIHDIVGMPVREVNIHIMDVASAK